MAGLRRYAGYGTKTGQRRRDQGTRQFPGFPALSRHGAAVTKASAGWGGDGNLDGQSRCQGMHGVGEARSAITARFAIDPKRPLPWRSFQTAAMPRSSPESRPSATRRPRPQAPSALRAVFFRSRPRSGDLIRLAKPLSFRPCTERQLSGGCRSAAFGGKQAIAAVPKTIVFRENPNSASNGHGSTVRMYAYRQD